MLWRWVVWLTRMHRCLGFGIQSPKDYAFVRYVINEKWPYYAYERLGKNDDWRTRKLGRLYMRLANWRQPTAMERDRYEEYWKAGCRSLTPNDLSPALSHCNATLCLDREGEGVGGEDRGLRTVELARVDIDDDWETVEQLLRRCDERSVVVVEDIWRDWQRWHDIEQDERVGTTYDLYYCGIVLFDKQRYGHHYKVNF